MKNIEDQIGCGYCIREQGCEMYDPKINKAKLGCKEFLHHEKAFIQMVGRVKRIKTKKNETSKNNRS